ADLRRHLACQTGLPVALIDLPTLQAGGGPAALASVDAGGAVLIDGVDAASLAIAGEMLWSEAGRRSLFCAGSSGVTQALVAAWRAAGLASGAAPAARAEPVDTLLVISGSCSPVTSAQIGIAIEAGYEGIALSPKALVADPGEIERAAARAVAALGAGRNCVLYTARGPLAGGEAAGDALGSALGRMLRRIVSTADVPRVLLAGGDTSSHAVAELGLDALTWAARLQRGSPLCRAHATGSPLDGLELVLKGGQIGSPDFFERTRLGTG
ncbi:MAG TPA: nucleotide-binding domain containing protein, partial [Sphingomonas sp.]